MLLKRLLALPVRAVDVEQTEPESEPQRRDVLVAGYYGVSQPPLSYERLATLLTEQQGPLPDNMQGGTGGALVSVGRLLIDGGGGGFGGEGERDGRALSAGYGSGYLTLGYVLNPGRAFRIYPLIGAGGAGAGTSLEIPDNPRDDEDINFGAGLLLFGLGIDFRLKFWRFVLVVGLRMGYQVMVAPSSEATRGLDLTGPFFRVIFGSGLSS